MVFITIIISNSWAIWNQQKTFSFHTIYFAEGSFYFNVFLIFVLNLNLNLINKWLWAFFGLFSAFNFFKVYLSNIWRSSSRVQGCSLLNKIIKQNGTHLAYVIIMYNFGCKSEANNSPKAKHWRPEYNYKLQGFWMVSPLTIIPSHEEKNLYGVHVPPVFLVSSWRLFGDDVLALVRLLCFLFLSDTFLPNLIVNQ